MSDLRSLPSVDKLIRTPAVEELISQFGRTLTVEAIRAVLDEIRSGFDKNDALPEISMIISRAQQYLNNWTAPTLKPLINATGIIIHTNLGRSPLSLDAIRSIQEISLGYSNLEYDLDTGKRGTRLVHAEDLLIKLTGAEGALVVNNNASAVLLILSALAKRRRVLIARSQLVEIGGGFRIPDVIAQSGAKLVEIGTTNRIHLYDYQDAIEQQPIKLVLRVHRSNFEIIGFHTEPTLHEIVEVSHAAGIPVIDDLGSGTLIDTEPYDLRHEPTVQDSLKSGVDLVSFSGDKLLGGPQAGIIVGCEEYIEKLKKHPLARAIRADKLVLSALSATLLHYLKGEAAKRIPVWQMITAHEAELQNRASIWASAIGERCEIVKGKSKVGGGSLPGQSLPTYLLKLKVQNPIRFSAKLRDGNPPVISRIVDNRVVLDPRTVLPNQDDVLVDSVVSLMQKKGSIQ